MAPMALLLTLFAAFQPALAITAGPRYSLDSALRMHSGADQRSEHSDVLAYVYPDRVCIKQHGSLDFAPIPPVILPSGAETDVAGSETVLRLHPPRAPPPRRIVSTQQARAPPIVG